MNRIPLIDPATATGKASELMAGVKKKLGLVPNMVRALAQSPAALQVYVDASGALAGASLSARLREQIALTVAEINSCGYCLSAHTLVGGKLGLTGEQILAARRAEAANAHENAVLQLSREIVLRRGEVRDADLRSAREAGVTDAEIAEIVAVVALNVLTNYFNHVAATPIDFPEVKPGVAAATAAVGSSCSTGACH
jgi:uncharacterized peroxidase-related enzyme